MKITKIAFLQIICLLICSFYSIAQDSTETKRVREFYIPSSAIFSVSNLGFRYKRQTGKKAFLNYGISRLSYAKSINKSTTSNYFNSKNTSVSAQFDIGIEFRNSLNKKIVFFYGPGFQCYNYYGHYFEDDPTRPMDKRGYSDLSISVGPTYTLGFMYKVCKNFYVAASISPYFSYQFSFDNYKEYASYDQNSYYNNLPNYKRTYLNYDLLSNSKIYLVLRLP